MITEDFNKSSITKPGTDHAAVAAARARQTAIENSPAGRKLRKAAAADRRLTLREILEKVFGLIPRFKSKDELLEDEFAKPRE